MPEAALQPFVTSQRQTGVAGRATTTGLAQVWTWQASPSAANEAGPTATSATKPGRRPFNQQNKLGNYHCNNRVYSISAGRWLSPDQAASPWWNLWDYCRGKVTVGTDPSGLGPVWKAWKKEAKPWGVKETETYKSTRGWLGPVLNPRYRGFHKIHNREFKFELEDCAGCDVPVDWIIEMIGAASRIIAEASVAADRIKEARDQGKTGWMDFAEGSDERGLLERFDWMEIPAGQKSTDAVNKLQKNLADMYWHLVNTGWKIECEMGDEDNDSLGYCHRAFKIGFGDIHIYADKHAVDRKDPASFIDTLLHELSHYVSGTDHGEDGDPTNDADKYGGLASGYKTPFGKYVPK